METSTGSLRDTIARRPEDQTCFGQTCFLSSTHKRIELTLTGYPSFYSEL